VCCAVLPIYLADYAYESAAPYNPAPSQQAYLPSPVAAGSAAAGRAAYQPYNPHSESLPVADAPYGGPAQRHGGYDPAPSAYTAAPARVQYAQPAPVASRHSRWSDRLMDPLDLNDGLLHNSVRTVALNTTALMMAPDRAAPASRRVSAATAMSAPRDSDMARYGPAADLSPSGSKRPRRDRSASPAPAVHAAGRSQSSTARRSRSPSASRAVRSAAEPVRKTSGLPFGARPPRPLSYATMPIAHLVADFNLPAVSVSTGADSVALRATDLYAKFPKLYLPNDLVSVCVDSGAALRALDGELYSNAINSVSTTAVIHRGLYNLLECICGSAVRFCCAGLVLTVCPCTVFAGADRDGKQQPHPGSPYHSSRRDRACERHPGPSQVHLLLPARGEQHDRK
jgi:hypothetical protein